MLSCQIYNSLTAMKRRVRERKSYREFPFAEREWMEIHRRWPWSFAPNQISVRLFDKIATGSPVIVAHCDGSVRNTDIVHKAASCEGAVN